MSSSRPWILKYLPKTISEVQGQDSVIRRILDFAKNYKKGGRGKNCLFIYGPTGCGKTSSVYAVANELDYETLEMNASDFRNKDIINSTVGQSIKQRSLFSRGKIILVDEVDGLSGKEDRGGVAAIAKLIAESSFPIILAATDPWNKKLSSIRSKCELLQFNTLSYLSVFAVLKKIADAEKISYDETALKRLARMSGGDLRAAINDLQTLSSHERINDEVVDGLADRDRKTKMMDALRIIFKSRDASIVRRVLDNVDEDLDKIKLWIDENLPLEYEESSDLARAYEAISRADVFDGRIRRRQHWRFMVYEFALLSVGVALAKREKSRKFVNYKPTSRILKLWKAKMKYEKRKAIAEKLASHSHCSSKEAVQSIIPYLSVIMKKSPEMAKRISEEIELDADEVKWLKANSAV